MDKSFFVGNRAAFAERLEDNSIAVFYSGKPVIRSYDEFYRFEPEKNFFYLTGLTQDNLILHIIKINGKVSEKLFMHQRSSRDERYIGKGMPVEEIEQISGISNLGYHPDRDREMSYQIYHLGVETIYFCLIWDRDPENPDLAHKRAAEMAARHPHLHIKNSAGMMIDLRYIKQPCEIEALQEAIWVTAAGLEKLTSAIPEARYEYQLRGSFESVLLENNCDTSFLTIVASGYNSLTLHYSACTGEIDMDNLILCDVGARKNYYCADISRIYPTNGDFTEKQKKVFDIVQRCQQMCFDEIRPGVMAGDINDQVIAFFAKELKVLGLIQDDSEVSRYYAYPFGHSIGLDAHEQSPVGAPFKENVVFAVEPGLTITEWGFGLRLEDMVLVTKDGCRVLTAEIPKYLHDVREKDSSRLF